MNKTKVFIIDDSVMVRSLFSQIINSSDDMEVIGIAPDPIIAERKMNLLEVDVIILDIEMPKMNGIDYLKKIMSTDPKPVIMCSSLLKDKQCPQALKALSLGAVDILDKDDSRIKEFTNSSSNMLIQSIKKASLSNIKKIKIKIPTNKAHTYCNLNSAFKLSTVVAIGSSTGGVQIIEKILSDLPKDTPAILIVQHMPAGFVASMANRINEICKINVKLAIDGEIIQQSTAYISPGDKHMYIKKDADDYRILLTDGMKISHHKPSVDVLFNSFAKEVPGYDIKAFILTGMGYDGAAGIKAIKNKGGKTYAQDEESCTVYGMPKEAVKLGAIDQSLAPEDMAKYIMLR